MMMKQIVPACTALGLAALVIGGCSRDVEREPVTQIPSTENSAEVSGPGTSGGEAAVANLSEIRYADSYEKAMETARAEGKPLMIDFYTDWCGVCKMMDQRVLNQKPVVQESQKFVNVKVNAEKREDLARTFGVTGYPTFIWLDTSGNIIERLDGGMMEDGFLERMQSAHSKFSAAVQL